MTIKERGRPPPELYSHHRAFVGQPQRYDVAGASQFALLFLLGLREHHRLLDFGCGSLRLGRMAIPYLQSGRYFGIEPEARLIDEGFAHELGDDIRRLKRPRFAHNSDYKVDVFGERFDFVVAQSVFSHTGERPAAQALKSCADSLAPGGMIVANWLLGMETEGSPADTADWVYPECVEFSPQRIHRLAHDAGLSIRPCPWPHPALHWFVLARDDADLPTLDKLRSLRVGPPAWD